MTEEGKTEPVKSDDNMMGALSYLLSFITGIVMYVTYRDKSKFVAFHGMQSIILGIAIFAVSIVVVPIVFMVSMVLALFTRGLGGLIAPLFLLLYMGVCLAITLILMYKAYNGEEYKIPYIGKLAVKYI